MSTKKATLVDGKGGNEGNNDGLALGKEIAVSVWVVVGIADRYGVGKNVPGELCCCRCSLRVVVEIEVVGDDALAASESCDGSSAPGYGLLLIGDVGYGPTVGTGVGILVESGDELLVGSGDT